MRSLDVLRWCVLPSSVLVAARTAGVPVWCMQRPLVCPTPLLLNAFHLTPPQCIPRACAGSCILCCCDLCICFCAMAVRTRSVATVASMEGAAAVHLQQNTCNNLFEQSEGVCCDRIERWQHCCQICCHRFAFRGARMLQRSPAVLKCPLKAHVAVKREDSSCRNVHEFP